MRPVLIAPGAVAGLRASQVAAAIGRGLEREGFECDLCPATDGGPGTLETLLVALGGETVAGGFALVEDGATAIVEAAATDASAGTRTTTAALLAARDSGAQTIVLAARGTRRLPELAALDLRPAKLIVLDDPSLPDATSGAPFVLDALDFDSRMRAARAVVAGADTLRRADLRGTLLAEVATRARQSGVPCFALAAHSELDRFDRRMLDLEIVAQAATLAEIERAAQALAPHMPSS